MRQSSKFLSAVVPTDGSDASALFIRMSQASRTVFVTPFSPTTEFFFPTLAFFDSLDCQFINLFSADNVLVRSLGVHSEKQAIDIISQSAIGSAFVIFTDHPYYPDFISKLSKLDASIINFGGLVEISSFVGELYEERFSGSILRPVFSHGPWTSPDEFVPCDSLEPGGFSFVATDLEDLDEDEDLHGHNIVINDPDLVGKDHLLFNHYLSNFVIRERHDTVDAGCLVSTPCAYSATSLAGIDNLHAEFFLDRSRMEDLMREFDFTTMLTYMILNPTAATDDYCGATDFFFSQDEDTNKIDACHLSYVNSYVNEVYDKSTLFIVCPRGTTPSEAIASIHKHSLTPGYYCVVILHGSDIPKNFKEKSEPHVKFLSINDVDDKIFACWHRILTFDPDVDSCYIEFPDFESINNDDNLCNYALKFSSHLRLILKTLVY